MSEKYKPQIEPENKQKIYNDFIIWRNKENQILTTINNLLIKHRYTRAELSSNENADFQPADFQKLVDGINNNLNRFHDMIQNFPNEVSYQKDYIIYMQILQGLNTNSRWSFHTIAKRVIKQNDAVNDKIDLTEELSMKLKQGLDDILIGAKSSINCLLEDTNKTCFNADIFKSKIEGINTNIYKTIDQHEVTEIIFAGSEVVGEFAYKMAFERMGGKIIETVINIMPKSIFEHVVNELVIKTADVLKFDSIESFVAGIIKLGLEGSGSIEVMHDKSKEYIAEIDLDEIKREIKSYIS